MPVRESINAYGDAASAVLAAEARRVGKELLDPQVASRVGRAAIWGALRGSRGHSVLKALLGAADGASEELGYGGIPTTKRGAAGAALKAGRRIRKEVKSNRTRMVEPANTELADTTEIFGAGTLESSDAAMSRLSWEDDVDDETATPNHDLFADDPLPVPESVDKGEKKKRQFFGRILGRGAVGAATAAADGDPFDGLPAWLRDDAPGTSEMPQPGSPEISGAGSQSAELPELPSWLTEP